MSPETSSLSRAEASCCQAVSGLIFTTPRSKRIGLPAVARAGVLVKR